MYSGRGNTPSRVLGFPIRTSADQHLVDSSPQLFAVTHVLHRFLAPRHPPLALCSLEEQRCSCLLCSSQRAPPASGSCSARSPDTPWQWSREGSCRGRGFGPSWWTGTDSLKTEEKTRSIDSKSRGGRILRHSTALDLPTSAPTGNWFEPDRTNAGHRLN